MDKLDTSTPRPVSLPTLDAPSATENARVQDILKGLSLTILGSSGEIEGPNSEISIKLQSPTVGPEDIKLNELLEQLDALGHTSGDVIVFREAVTKLAEGAQALADGILRQPPLDNATIVALGNDLEGQAQVVETQLRDILENSNYANYSDFLKELVKISQELREAASKAKLAAINANYELLYQAADQMKTAAEESKTSREKQIEADKMEAIGDIVGGAAGILTAWAGPVSQSVTATITGSFKASTTDEKTASSTAQYNADLANVAKTRLEAAAKLVEARVQIADDIRDLAKSLRDMILKLYQDFISAHNQVAQRANV